LDKAKHLAQIYWEDGAVNTVECIHNVDIFLLERAIMQAERVD
jgi:hypothetical protein